MRGLFARLLVCLILGAVTTVGVAWLLAMYSVRWQQPVPVDVRGTDMPLVLRSFGRLHMSEFHSNRSDERIRSFGGYSLTGTDTREYGWPALAMKSRVQFYFEERGIASGWDLPKSELAQRGFPTTRLPNWMGASTNDRLPIMPVFPAFLVNTLIFAAAWFVMLLAFGASKRARRQRRGLCPTCRYNLRGDFRSGCPECGWRRTPDANEQ